MFKGRKTTLIPMTPQEVYEDQLYLQRQKETRLIKQPNLFIKANEVNKYVCSDKPLLLFVFKEAV